MFAKRRAGGLCLPMPVTYVVLEAVVRRQIEAAAEPPHRVLARLFGNEESHIGMGCGHIGVARMNHQRNAHRTKSATGQLGARRTGRWRQVRAVYIRKADTGALEHGAVREDAAYAAAAFLAVPGVRDEARLAVESLQFAADPVLQSAQIGFDGAGVGHIAHTVLDLRPYRRSMNPLRTSRIGVGPSRPPSGPGTRPSISERSCRRTRVALRAGSRPARLALVDTMAPPK